MRKDRLLYQRLHNYTKPVISAVEGFCLGAGLEIALLGDFVVAGENAQFGFPEVKYGLMPGAGGTQTLLRVVGKAMAKELMWTGRRLSAVEAKDLRIVNHVVASGMAATKAREIIGSMLENAPLSIMMIKQAVNRGADMPMTLALRQEADLAYLLTFSEDRAEGLKAFAEKRRPEFDGR